MELRQQGFQVGIAGCGLADAMLFRHMKLPYLKICETDLEAYRLQQLNIPLLTSYSASLQQPYLSQQDVSSFWYRLQFSFDYQLNKLVLYKHRQSIATELRLFS